MLKEDFIFLNQREVGFGAQYKMVLCLINYCIDNEIKCDVDIRNTLYSDENTNIWNLIFDQPFLETNSKTIIYSGFDDLPGFREYWKLGIGSWEREKYCDYKFVENYRKICKQHIFIKKDLLEYVNSFLINYKDKKILGIHNRGTDLFINGHAQGQKDLILINDLYNLIDKEKENYDYIFCAADEYNVYSEFRKKYENKLIVFDDKEKYKNQAIHIIPKSHEEKEESLKSLIIEILILSKCNKLLLMNSNVSHMALFFANHNNYTFYDNHLTYR